jgi:hypothetical protein
MKTSILAFAVVTGTAFQPTVVEEGFKSILSCNNRAIELHDQYSEVWCEVRDSEGRVVEWSTTGEITYITPKGFKQPDTVIEIRE